MMSQQLVGPVMCCRKTDDKGNRSASCCDSSLPEVPCDVHFSISYQLRCRTLFQSYPNLTFRICTTFFPLSLCAPLRLLLYDTLEPYLDPVTRSVPRHKLVNIQPIGPPVIGHSS